MTKNVCMQQPFACSMHEIATQHAVLNLQLQIVTRLSGILPEKLQALVQGLFRHCQKEAAPKSCYSIAAAGRNFILEQY